MSLNFSSSLSSSLISLVHHVHVHEDSVLILVEDVHEKGMLMLVETLQEKSMLMLMMAKSVLM